MDRADTNIIGATADVESLLGKHVTSCFGQYVFGGNQMLSSLQYLRTLARTTHEERLIIEMNAILSGKCEELLIGYVSYISPERSPRTGTTHKCVMSIVFNAPRACNNLL